MSVFFIINIEISNEQDRRDYDLYTQKVKPVVESFGGEYLIRSENITPLAAEKAPDRIIIIRFKNREQLEACFTSPEYAGIQDLRQTSVKAHAFIVEE